MAERAAIVTGGSSGIGLAIAEMLGEEGYGLTLAARRPDKLADAAEVLRGKGYEVQDVAGNLSDEDVIKTSWRRTETSSAASTCSSTMRASASARRSARS